MILSFIYDRVSISSAALKMIFKKKKKIIQFQVLLDSGSASSGIGYHFKCIGAVSLVVQLCTAFCTTEICSLSAIGILWTVKYKFTHGPSILLKCYAD